jgi:hypothetical protein
MRSTRSVLVVAVLASCMLALASCTKEEPPEEAPVTEPAPEERTGEEDSVMLPGATVDECRGAIVSQTCAGSCSTVADTACSASTSFLTTELPSTDPPTAGSPPADTQSAPPPECVSCARAFVDRERICRAAVAACSQQCDAGGYWPTACAEQTPREYIGEQGYECMDCMAKTVTWE